MFTKEQCLTIAYALSFERSQDRGHDESTISVAKVIEQMYPGLLAEKSLNHLLKPA